MDTCLSSRGAGAVYFVFLECSIWLLLFRSISVSVSVSILCSLFSGVCLPQSQFGFHFSASLRPLSALSALSVGVSVADAFTVWARVTV